MKGLANIINPSLDAEANQKFHVLIKSSLYDRTVIAVEHNPKNVLDYDKVIVLQGGQIIGAGFPTELANVDSAFRRLLQLSEGIQWPLRGSSFLFLTD